VCRCGGRGNRGNVQKSLRAYIVSATFAGVRHSIHGLLFAMREPFALDTWRLRYQLSRLARVSDLKYRHNLIDVGYETKAG
jgi:hypothetical protein